jgi:uncharacterized protein YaaQ
MKLVAAVIQDRDAGPAVKTLAANDIGVTRIATSGGFLEQGNTTLFMGVEEAQVALVIDLLRSVCHRRTIYMPMAAGIADTTYGLHSQVEVEIGGAAIFVFDVEHFEQV